jgi:hypothetical protein
LFQTSQANTRQPRQKQYATRQSLANQLKKLLQMKDTQQHVL